MRFHLLLLAALLASPLPAAEPPPIQQWIDEAIQAGGGVVTIPEGEHLLPQRLVIRNAQKLALRGVNKEACVLKRARSSTQHRDQALIEITGKADTLEIANLTLDGGPELSASPSVLIHLHQAPAPSASPFKDVVIRDCLFQQFGQTAILLSGGSGLEVERCSFRDGGVGVRLEKATEKSVLRGNQLIRVATAFEVETDKACLIEGNEVFEAGIGIRLITPPPQPSIHELRHNGFHRLSQAEVQLPQTASPDAPKSETKR